MADYGIKIAKTGYTASTAANKNLAFNSALPCLKILQCGKSSAVSSSEVTVTSLSFPMVVLVYLYDSATSKYEPINVEFTSTKLYLPGGEAANSYYYYYVCYA